MIRKINKIDFRGKIQRIKGILKVEKEERKEMKEMRENEDKLYNKAIYDIKKLSEDVLKQCINLAKVNNYEVDWVIEKFKREFKIKYQELSEPLGS